MITKCPHCLLKVVPKSNNICPNCNKNISENSLPYDGRGKFKRCPKCKLENPESAEVCDCGYNFATKEVGKPIHKAEPPKAQTVNKPVMYEFKVASQDLEMYVGEQKQAYYMSKWSKLDVNRKFFRYWSWNWAAFFFGPFWFIYRKMYLWGILILAIPIILSYILPTNRSVCASLFFGACANWLYLSTAEKEIMKIRSSVREELCERRVIEKGGTNIAGCILSVILVIGASCFAWYIMGDEGNITTTPNATASRSPAYTTSVSEMPQTEKKVLMTPDEAIRLIAERYGGNIEEGLKFYEQDKDTGYYSISWSNPGKGSGASWDVDPYTGDVYQLGNKVFNLFEKSTKIETTTTPD